MLLNKSRLNYDRRLLVMAENTNAVSEQMTEYLKTDQSLARLEAGLDALDLGSTHDDQSVWKKRSTAIIAPLVALGVFLVVWQLAFALELRPDYVIPSPAMVWDSFVAQWDAGQVLPSVRNSLSRGFIGFLLSIAIATPLGILVARSRAIRLAIRPILTGLQQLPSVAWVPAAIIWFGLTPTTIYCVVILGAVPSIANGLVSGIDQIQPVYLRVGKVLGFSGLQNITRVVLPAALPGYISGIEQGWAFAWRSLMAAELIAVSPDLGPGLGQMLEVGRTLGDMSLIVMSIFLILIVGILVERALFAPIRRRVFESRGLTG
jgi:NitT/TauT family transport system permease protein